MLVLILGSGSPTPLRAGPSTLVRLSVGGLLLDAGLGVSTLAAGGLSGPDAVRAVSLTHHENLSWRPATVAGDVTEGVEFGQGAVRTTTALTDHAPVHVIMGHRTDVGTDSVVIAGDTVPYEGLDRPYADADVLVHTVVCQDQIEALRLTR